MTQYTIWNNEKRFDYRNVRVPYKVGDVITRTSFSGDTTKVFVQTKYEDLENWRVGFEGYLAGDNNKPILVDGKYVPAWGYHYEVVAVEDTSLKH